MSHAPTPKRKGRPSLSGTPSVSHFLTDAQRKLWQDDTWCQKYEELIHDSFATRFNRRRPWYQSSDEKKRPAVNGIDYYLAPAGDRPGSTRDILEDAKRIYKVKIRAYATDRLKVVSYPFAVRPLEKRMSRRSLANAVCGSNKFRSRFEPRRTYLIGGRRREIPRFTSWTTHARDYARDGAACIEKYSKGVCFFNTFTIPGRSPEAHRVVSAGSGYMVDRFTRWLRDKCVDGLYVLVWEVQADGTPHVHIMMRLQGDAHITQMYTDMREQWHKILLDVSNQTGVNLLTTDDAIDWMVLPSTVNCNYKVVSDDMAGYIAKYMSKAESKGDGTFSFRPGRWMGLSAPLRALVRGRRFEQVFEIAGPEKFAEFINSLSARSFDLFDRLICFPRQEIVRPDVYSFECSPNTGREVGIAVAAWCLYGDITELEVLESERKERFITARGPHSSVSRVRAKAGTRAAHAKSVPRR